MLLSGVEYKKNKHEYTGYPFDLAAVASLDALEFDSSVTLFVGENGSGKSTLLTAISCAARAINIGESEIEEEEDYEKVRPLANCLKLKWQSAVHKGFLFRAEDFIRFIKRITRMKRELNADLERIDLKHTDKMSFAYQQERMAYAGSLHELRQRYGELTRRSHGEGYLDFFASRLVPDGLYLLDEPETPLSFTNQLTLISMMHEMSQKGCQFILCTHSPVLMAYPGAAIYAFDERIERVHFSQIDSVKQIKTFLDAPERFLRYYFEYE